MEPVPEHIGRYRVIAPIAEGGMAQILLARIEGPLGVSRPVVVKRILPRLAREPRFRNMFLDEARIVAGIRHSNVVTLHELVGEDEQLYLVMEYLEGESLHRLARWLGRRERRLPLAVCCYVMAEASSGLHAAHDYVDEAGKAQNVVHRDVSPHNIFINYDGGVKLIDFGVAKAEDRVEKTTTGTVKGKFSYMAPEQLDGRPLDRRSDIFAAGVVLFEITTGRRLFRRRSHAETIHAICYGDVPRPSTLVDDYPEGLERIVLRALAKDPADRYPTAAALARDLSKLGRSLEPAALPREQLALLMDEAFAEQRAQKQSLLRAGRPIGAPLLLEEGSDSDRLDEDALGHSLGTDPLDTDALDGDTVDETPLESARAAARPLREPRGATGAERPRALVWLAMGLATVLVGGVAAYLVGPEDEAVAGVSEQPRMLAPADPSGAENDGPRGDVARHDPARDDDARSDDAQNDDVVEDGIRDDRAIEASSRRLGPHVAPSTDAPGAESAESATVTLSIHVEPRGAEVTVDGETRGAAPLELAVPRADRPLRITARRRGHRTASRTVTPTRDARVELRLARRAGATRGASPTPRDEERSAPTFFRVD